MEITPIIKLDTVLFELKAYRTGMSKDVIMLNTKQNEGVDIAEDEVNRIVEKLEKDGYVIPTNHGRDTFTYAISFDGNLFHGYARQREIDEINNFNAAQNEKRIIRNDKWLTRGTWFAGLAAVLLLLWQIFLYFYPPHTDAVHVILQK